VLRSVEQQRLRAGSKFDREEFVAIVCDRGNGRARCYHERSDSSDVWKQGSLADRERVRVFATLHGYYTVTTVLRLRAVSGSLKPQPARSAKIVFDNLPECTNS